MKFTRFLLPALLVLGMSVNLSAAETEEAPETITYQVDLEHGVLTGSGNYRSTWTSSIVEDGINVVSNGPSGNPANNFENTSSGNLKLNTGKPAPATVVISALKGGKWYVSHYSFKAVHNTSATDLTLAVQGRAAQPLVAGTEFAVDETLTKDQTASFVFAGTNGNPVEFKDFTVTITLDPEYEEPEYVLPVETDLIVNGKFDEWTTWYNLQLAENQYALFNNGSEKMTFTGIDSGCFKDPEHLWAFVLDNAEENTVKIYNRATGTDKVLAAPKGGTGYPRMMAEGDANYCYTWKLRPAEYNHKGETLPSLFNGTRAVYISLSDNDNAILNNFGGFGQLDFWTGGYDKNSVIVPVVIESKVAVDMKNGFLKRAFGAEDAANRWQGYWVYGGQLNIQFGMEKNNLTISEWGNPNDVTQHPDAFLQIAASEGSNTFKFVLPNEYYVSDLSMKISTPSEDGKVTLYVGSSHEEFAGSQTFELSGREQKVVNMKDLPHDFELEFVTTGVNHLNNNVILSDFVIVIKRYIREFIDPNIVYEKGKVNHQIRIPAITTVGKGENAGRLITAYDYRWCNGDLGGGNIDLTIATSDDNGKTWTAPDFARDAEGNPVTEYNHKWTKGDDWATVKSEKATEAWDAAWGDAALCADRESQTVMMIAVGGPIGFFGSRRANTQSAIRWISNDGGTTWSEPMNITEKIYSLFDGEPLFAGRIDGMFFGSGRAMQSRYVKVGDYYRVYAVISSQVNGGNTRNYVLYTDDMGENWNVLGSAAQCPVKSNGDEPKCEELPDGSVILAARANGGNRNFNVFRYTNPTTGEGQWMGNHINTNMGMGGINACDGEIYILPVTEIETGESCFMALQSFPYGGGRNNVSIAWKVLNEGADFVNANCFTKWTGRYQVCNGSSAYTTMSLMNNGHIGFFYEHGITGTYDGVFKEIPVETITDGRYKFYCDVDNVIAQSLTQSLVEYRMENYTGENADAVKAAGDAYLDNPTYANYIKFNRAEYGEPAKADNYDFAYEGTELWPDPESQQPVVEELTIEPASVVIKVGETATLTASEEGEIVWTSSNELVCTVEAGVVTGVAAGNAIITATLGDRQATCSVTVEPNEGENPEDGITEISAGSDNVIFDMQGRRVINPSRGIYIVNGKKVKN